MKRRAVIAIATIVGILIVDQATKLLVRTSMHLHETIDVLPWFKICYIENNGMALGMEIGSKLFLTIFRIVAIALIGYYLYGQVKAKTRTGYIVCLAMVVAGAAGNVIDCMFYGLIFDYAPFMMGRVVDMLYFPLIVGAWPSWVPILGGQEFIFFSPIFNIADACITVSVFLLIIFYRKEVGSIQLKVKK